MDIIFMLLSLGLGIADEIKASPHYESKQEREANATSVYIYNQFKEQERKRKEKSDKEWAEYLRKWDEWKEIK